MNLKNKRILITAGPTWVPIDAVRVISNIATAETGVLLARKAKAYGAVVTLFLGPVPDGASSLDKSIRVIRFNFFDEFKTKLIKEIKTKKYDFIIHSAAVADYRLKKIYRFKIRSGLKRLNIELVPNQKVLNLFKEIDRSLKIVAFKFEIGINRRGLIKKAKELLRRSKADLVIANTVINKRYIAYIVSLSQVSGQIYSKNALTDKLLTKLGE